MKKYDFDENSPPNPPQQQVIIIKRPSFDKTSLKLVPENHYQSHTIGTNSPSF